MKTITVAVVGNPNVGKTALLNEIAGTNLKVGNWPGVTIEKKEASIRYKDYIINFVDLPGMYSLKNQTAEEKVTMEFLLKERPDLILNVVDSTNLRRNLYLTIQLLELEIPMVISLNIWDEVIEKGILIDVKKLQKLLFSPVVPTSAKTRDGIIDLLDKILESYENKRFVQCEHFETNFEQYLKEVINLVDKYKSVLLDVYPKRYLAVSLLEGSFKDSIPPVLSEEIEKIRKKIKEIHRKDVKTLIIEERYGDVLSIYQQVVKKEIENIVEHSYYLDKIFLNKYFGLPLFLFLVWLTFEVTFKLSSPYVDFLDKTLSVVSICIISFLEQSQTSDFLKSFVSDAVIGGVGFVLTFVPVLLTLYMIISFLEGSGYISRAAFLMDKFMSFLGLSGKSFIPLLLGFGCNVPAVYATRTIENPKEKILTTLMIPFMSCGARLTVFALFVTVFFQNYGGFVIFSLYLIGIMSSIIVAFILNKLFFKTKSDIFILELPPYRLPTLKYIFINTWIKVKAFLIEAGTFIFATSIVIWFLTNTPFGVKKDESYLAKISQTISVIFEPLGFGNWQATASLFSGFVAKEVVLSAMGNIYIGEEIAKEEEKLTIKEGLNKIGQAFIDANIDVIKNFASIFGFINENEEGGNGNLAKYIRDSFTKDQAFSFLVFLLLYTPCLATVFAIKQELNSYKWMFLSIAINFTTAWIVTFIFYNILKLV